MTRFLQIALGVFVVSAFLSPPALAQDPGVTTQILVEDDGRYIVVLNVSARDRDIYGITLEDRNSSIDDISSPDGWAGVASEDKVVFSTVDEPITLGRFAAFRIVTTKRPDFRISFRDERSSFGLKKTI